MTKRHKRCFTSHKTSFMMFDMKTSAAQCSSPTALSGAKRLGAAMAEARKRRGLTQDSLASQAGLSTPTIQRLEQGQPQISVGRLFDLLDVLDPQMLEQVVDVLEADTLGRAMVARQLPERVRSRRRDF